MEKTPEKLVMPYKVGGYSRKSLGETSQTYGICNNTPVEEHNGIWVKREDLCAPHPGPSFSKYRGVVAHIRNRPESVIGVLDTLHSKAGRAVAYACQQLGKRCVNFYPHYKAEPEGHIRENQRIAAEMGATLAELPAGRSSVLYHFACRRLREEHPDSYMMPNALKLPESVLENADEAFRTETLRFRTIVLSVSSGTIAAGVIRGIMMKYEDPMFVLHMGYSRSHSGLRNYITDMISISLSGWYHQVWDIVDEGYGYADAVDWPAPFPCNPHYDLKAWKWLSMYRNTLPQPVLFWNIGA